VRPVEPGTAVRHSLADGSSPGLAISNPGFIATLADLAPEAVSEPPVARPARTL
jgi:hypothetical protein